MFDVRALILTFTLGGVLLLLLILSWGCSFHPPYLRNIPPQTSMIVSSRLPDAAYTCAVTVFRKQSDVARLASDPQARVATGQWHHAAEMTIAVEPDGAGSLVTIHGSVPRNKVTTGDFDEVPTLATLVKEQCS